MCYITLIKRFHVSDVEKVMLHGAEAGRIMGRDQDWSPVSLEAAIDELDTFDDGYPLGNDGYRVVSANYYRDFKYVDLLSASKLLLECYCNVTERDPVSGLDCDNEEDSVITDMLSAIALAESGALD